jgi:hypothetical protein
MKPSPQNWCFDDPFRQLYSRLVPLAAAENVL